MDYIEREQWIEVCQMFFDAYAKFQIDGTEAHWYGCTAVLSGGTQKSERLLWQVNKKYRGNSTGLRGRQRKDILTL